MSEITVSIKDKNGRVLIESSGLDNLELVKINKIVCSWLRKIKYMTKYEQFDMYIGARRKGKGFWHVVKAHVKAGKNVFNAEQGDFNMYKAVAEVMKKIRAEMLHKLKK